MQLILTGVERRDNVLKRLHKYSGGEFTKNWNGKDIPIIVGNLNNCDNIQTECRKQNIPYIYIDHGYFNREFNMSWARFCINNYHCTDWRPSNRNIPKIKEYRKGDDIVILPPANKVSFVYNAYNWLDKTIEEIRQYSDRKIIIKRKSEGGLLNAIKNAHCVVSFGSVADVEASVHGVPVIVSDYSPAIPISNKLEDIEKLTYPDREPWLRSLAAAEWHQDEMDKCWERLKGQLDGIY